MEMNYIRVYHPKLGKTLGFAVVEKGSEEEIFIVDKFVDAGFSFAPSNKEEYEAFQGGFVKKFDNGLFCTEMPMAD